MDRNVPRTGSEEIELYIRTYDSLLRSSDEVQIKSLVEAHAQMDSSLHPAARSTSPDMSAFIYTALRLPACLRETLLFQLPDALSAMLHAAHEARVFHDAQVLGNRLAGDGEAGAQPRNRGRSVAGEARDQAEPGPVPQRGKHRRGAGEFRGRLCATRHRPDTSRSASSASPSPARSP